MNYPLVFLFTLSFSLGVFTIGVAAALYFQHKKRSISCFLLFISGLTCDVLSFLFSEYGAIPGYEWGTFGDTVTLSINHLASLLILFSLPRFIYTILLINKTKWFTLFYNSLLGIQVILVLVSAFFGADERWQNITKIPLYLTVIIVLILTARNYSSIGDKMIRRAAVFLFAAAGALLPFILVNGFFGQAIPEQVSGIIGIFTAPTLLIMVTLGLSFFGILYFNRPEFVKDNQLTEHFLKTYGISPRESDILILLIGGDNKEQIGDKLFISPNTVNNHVYRIYKKLEVKNRVQLLNLINSRQV